MSAEIPSQLGRYQVLEILGRGAMGVVYLARDPALNRKVALKTFHVGRDVDDHERHQFRERFLREAQSCGMLNHPNIVTLHDVVELAESDSAFMAMEYVRGTNLKQLIQRGESFPPEFIVSVVEQIAAGLDYAHSRGVIHRDVKPANILLTEASEAKITDFGIARFNASNLTHAGQLLGTPNYMAPEQIRGGEVDHRADLFSLGVLVYELLTRRKPFQGDNLTMVTHRIVYEDFEPPDQFVENFPPELKVVLSKALAKAPGDRYPNALSLARDLKAVLAPPVAATDPLNDTQGVRARPPAAAPLHSPPPPPERPPQRLAPGSEDTQPSSIPTAPPFPDLDPPPPPPPPTPEWRQQLDSVLDQTRTVLRKAVPPEARPPRRRVLAYALGGALLLVLGLVVAAVAHRQLRPGVAEELAAQRMQWSSAFSSLMVAGAQELEQGQPVSAVERFAEARRMLLERRQTLQARRDQLRDRGDATAVQTLEEDLQSLQSLDASSSEALGRAEWRREEERYLSLRRAAAEEAVEAARQALDRRDVKQARAAVREALELDPGYAEALQLEEELDGRRPAPPVRQAVRRPTPPPPPATPVPAIPAPDQEAEAVPQQTTLSLTLISDLPKGVLLIYLDEDQLLRESFRFGEKSGLFRRSKAETGRLQKRLTVPAGDHSLRIYVSGARNRPTEVRRVDGSFPAGGSRRLEIRVDAEGEVDVSLR